MIWKGDLLKVQRMLAASEQKIADGDPDPLPRQPRLLRARAAVSSSACARSIPPSPSACSSGAGGRRWRPSPPPGSWRRNRALPLPELPLSIALITSHGSAAYHDFLSGLVESGYGFRVLFLHAAMQGKDAEREVVSALRGARWPGGSTAPC